MAALATDVKTDPAEAIELSPFHEIVKTGHVARLPDGKFELTHEYFVAMLWPVLRQLKFDEAYYRNAYPDLRDAESKGVIKDLYHHYVHFGYFEGRLPCFVEVDGAFYAKAYPDVAKAIVEGKVVSAQAHFERAGFVEGRLPRRGWSFEDLLAT